MSNPYYNVSGTPVTGSAGASAAIRSEYAAIAAGFDKLPGTLAANKAVVINAGGTGMTVTTGSLALAGDFSTTGAFNTVFAQQASITITLPATATTLVGRDTVDTLTNKTLTSPVLTTPDIGTPSAGMLTNCTGLPISTGVSGLGTGIATFLATPSSTNLLAAVTDETGTGALVFATSPTLVTPILGTPTSGTLTNCTGLPISTGVSGLAANMATFLATATSANLAAAVSDETGSGALVFATSPTLVTPLLGTPTSGTLTNCTGLPISTGVSGLGSNVATFLATPSSANLAAAVTDETGSGALVFATSPTFTTSATINTRDGTNAQKNALLILNGNAAGTGTNFIGTQMTDTVGTSPTVILSSPARATLVLVSGSSGGDLFSDILLVNPNNFTVLASLTDAGSPPARTYSMSAFALMLAMASSGSNINVVALGADMRN